MLIVESARFGLSRGALNPFTTGNPFLGTKLLAISIGRGWGLYKGVKPGYPL